MFKNIFLCFFLLADCGGEINVESGQLQSPNYPNSYPNDKDCHWIITAPFGFAIALDFQTFEVKYECIKEFWGFEAPLHYLLYRNIA